MIRQTLRFSAERRICKTEQAFTQLHYGDISGRNRHGPSFFRPGRGGDDSIGAEPEVAAEGVGEVAVVRPNLRMEQWLEFRVASRLK